MIHRGPRSWQRHVLHRDDDDAVVGGGVGKLHPGVGVRVHRVTSAQQSTCDKFYKTCNGPQSIDWTRRSSCALGKWWFL